MGAVVNLKSTVAFVTGASHGIGRATASTLHEHGAAVGLVARSGDELRVAAQALGTSAAFAVADVADKMQVDRAMAELEDQLGKPDILVNNAGIGAYASILEEKPEVYERLIRVNYLGTVYATLAVLPSMAALRRGHIVNIASVAGRLGAPFEAAYSASKFAVVGFSESLAAEVQALGVRVSVINPGPVNTQFSEARGVPFQRKVPRPVKPERIAAAVIKAIERDRFEQTVPRWLRSGSIARSIAPNLYRRALLRDSSKEASALARRVKSRTE